MTTDGVGSGRQVKFADWRLETVEGDGRFAGYASVFGAVDLGRDAIERGAFARSIERRGPGGVRMLYQHDPAEPIGAWTAIREDGRGLYVEGQLASGVERAREVHALMKAGALDGLSIGFETVRARTDAKTGVRRILEADLWEISVVTFPMLPEARVSRVKHASLPHTKRDLERRLMHDAGLTRSEARTLMAKGFDGLSGMQDAAVADTEGLVARIRAAARMMNGTTRT
ncbi:HK97 family phage prohead protease [Pararhizobium mangrovi]|uniref:HK97 family phage prohead protease n=1 Tax=Pararhizobium mangrovi TaxID=2590452 RepID=A0A506UHF7_9HYPH|nr:HK97 family phage prohead protease [Pararhizobium mangrovi]TPW32755.1 HK97 family phage prohead protease [Pararhizobium mangrovi]